MIRILAFGLAAVTSLYGQRRFSWQDACFNNLAAPYCSGRDFAIKPPAAKKNTGSKNIVTNPFPSTQQHVTPSVIMVGGIDWRFADPSADALAGFNISGLSSSPIARKLIAQLGAKHLGATEADMNKIFEGLSGVDHVGLSIRDGRIVIMATRAPDSTLPALEAGWKAVPVSGNAMLIGHADAVDEAVQRIAMKGPLAELTSFSDERQANSEFWAIGSGRFIGPQAESAGLKRFSLAVSVRDGFTSDVAFEFNEVPSPDALRIWPELRGAAIDGNVVHGTIVEADDVQQRFGEIAGSPLGERLVALVTATRYLPVRDVTALKQSKPVIYGLDGGPKVVNQYQNH